MCDENNDEMIDVEEFSRILNIYLFFKKDLKLIPEISEFLYKIVKSFLKYHNNTGKKIEIHKDIFFNFVLNNEILKKIILRNIENIGELDQLYEEKMVKSHGNIIKNLQ